MKGVAVGRGGEVSASQMRQRQGRKWAGPVLSNHAVPIKGAGV